MKTRTYISIAILAMAALAADPTSIIAAEQKHLATLKSDAPLFEKARACEQLAIVGTKQSVPTLAALLSDEQLGDYARLAMEPIEDPTVDIAFRNALGKLKGRLLAGVVTSIGTRRDAEAVPALKQLLKDPDSGAHTQTLTALGNIATEDAIHTLRGMLKEGPANLRTASAHASLLAAQNLTKANDTRDALVLYNAVRSADVPAHLRSAATYRAILTEGAHSIPLLIEQLKTDDPAMVETALRAARLLPSRNATKALAAELPDLNPIAQALMIKALLDRNDPAVSPGIQKLAQSEHQQVRIEALKALGKIGNADSVTVLLKAASAPGPETDIALSSLRTIDSAGVEQMIVEGMKKADAKLKPALIDIISARRFTSATAPLLNEASSEDKTVAIAALKALTKLAQPDDLPALITVIGKIDHPATITQAETTIAAVALKIQDESQRLKIVMENYPESVNETPLSLLRILGKIATDKAVETLQSALETGENLIVRDTALRALASCPNPKALTTLSKVAATGKNRIHRTIAFRGYIRLLGVDTQTPTETKLAMYASALQIAPDPAEKKLVLAGLAKLNRPDALPLATACLDDFNIANEAAFAALVIAQMTAGAAPEKARQAALKVAKVANNGNIQAKAEKLAKSIEAFDDFLVAWQVAGPYTDANRDHGTLHWMGFEPETPGNKAQWSLMPAATNPAKPWMLDLLALYPGNLKAAYVRTTIISQKAQPAVLELGSDDGIKAWLNGKLVHNNGATRAAIPASDKVKINLKAGTNSLMLKITQNVLTWEFCAKLKTPDGKKLEGINIDCLQ